MTVVVLITLALVMFFVLVGRRLGLLSPSSLFLYSQYAMAMGIIPQLDRGTVADQDHQYLLLFTFLSYVISSIVVVGALDRGLTRRAYSPVVSFDYPSILVNFWVLVSIAIGIAYYAAIGYVALFESLSAVVEGGDEDVAGLRLESYAGSRYLFPGYVNQFKNALLPALFLVIVTAAFSFKKPMRWFIAIGLGSITLVLLVGTGQRHPFIKALVLAVLFVYFAFPKRSVRSMVSVAAVGTPVFVVTTFASGRLASQLESASSISDRATIFADGLFNRLFSSSQLGAVTGFRYIHNRDPIPFASEWIQGLYGLLPGQSGSGIANEIFEVLFGSTRGTSPISIWVSAYYNLGFGGAVVFASLLGIVFALVSASFIDRESINLIQAVALAGITTTLGLWVSGGPTTILNDGIAVFLLLLVWGNRIEARKGSQSRHEAYITKYTAGSRASVYDRDLSAGSSS